jgi:asparagine synthase (glutamine-hydrolysing)
MCGIAGIMRFQGGNDLEAVRHMTRALAHRGPDAEAVIEDRGATLGHRRLSVIDLDHAADQPMQDPESGAWIVFNGEIYNYANLRRELETEGARFRTKSDTEVLLAGLVRHGASYVERLNGMFAFAVWLPRDGRLILARDRLGKKPLYYQNIRDGLVFASDLTALSLHPEVSRHVDPIALGQYLGLGYTTTERCIVEGVKKLPPSHVLTVARDGRQTLAPYWDLAVKLRDKRAFASEAEAADAIGAALDESVRARLVSDVPLGAFLSGGVDSAAIAESIVRQRGGDAIRALTMDFDVADHSEVAAATETARVIGMAHEVRMVAADAMLEIDKITRFADEPFADTSMLPMFQLSALARQSMTVALSGDGGDELFAGYVTNTADLLHRATSLVPGSIVRGAAAAVEALWRPNFGKVSADYKVRRFLAGHELDDDRAHVFWRGIFDAGDRAALLRPEHEAARTADPFDAVAPHATAVAGCHPVDRAMYIDIKTWLADDVLVKVDRMSMAHGLEVRAPFLDHRLVELAAQLKPEWKFRRLRGKRILRRALSRRLPPRILDRPKQGFNAPVSRWLEGPFGAAAREATLSAAMREWFVPAAIEALWTEHLTHRRDNGYRLFTLLCLALWLERRRA